MGVGQAAQPSRPTVILLHWCLLHPLGLGIVGPSRLPLLAAHSLCHL